MDVKEKQELAYEEALSIIKNGTPYYSLKIQEIKQQMRSLSAKDNVITKGLSISQIEDKKQYLQGQVNHLQRKSGEFVEKQHEIRDNYLTYQRNIEKKGANYFGDSNLISNLALARGLSKEVRGKDKITVAFKKEFGKIEKDVNISYNNFEKALTKNAVYMIDGDGRQVFRKSDFSDITFKNMLVEKNNVREENYPKEQTLQDLEKEQKEILSSIDGYNQIKVVMNPENEFNISDSMKKDLGKCNKIYEDISKHKQVIGKIEEVLSRFEVDEEYNKRVGIDEDKKDRSKEYAKLCKELHKLKVKEEKKIAKLQTKVKKPMQKNNVSKLCSLVEDRKAVEVNKNKVFGLEKDIAFKEDELRVLLNQKRSIEENEKISNEALKFEELKNINKDIERLEKEIRDSNKNLQESKVALNESQEKIKSSTELNKYTTKGVMKQEDYTVSVSTSNEFKKSFTDTLKEQTTSQEEYYKSKEERETQQKSKDEKQKNQDEKLI